MQRQIGVVFVSRRNSLRSVLAQACLAHLDSKQRFAVRSCGRPGKIERAIRPAAAGALNSAGIAVPHTAGHDWNELMRNSAFSTDLVIVLDADVEPLQPRWPGQPDVALWDYPDVAASDDVEQAAHGAIQILHSLKRRLELLIALPLQGADRSALRADVRDMAYMR